MQNRGNYPPQSNGRSGDNANGRRPYFNYNGNISSTPNNGFQFQVLYTHQKTKNIKSWKDGRLVLSGTHGSLYMGSGGEVIDTLQLTRGEAEALDEGDYTDGDLESGKFLIQVGGPWIDATSSGGAGGRINDPLWNKWPLVQSNLQRGAGGVNKQTI